MVSIFNRPHNYPVIAAVVVGALYRLWLMPRYAGWEESDYGNLAMIHGVLEGGFRHYDMNHMPGYYAVAALVHAFLNDAVVAGRGVSLVGGLIALGIAVAMANRLGGPRAGWLAALLGVVQPEFALYASSSLREPLAAAFVLISIHFLGRERMSWAGLFAGFAFLVRFDYALVMGPVLAFHAMGRPDSIKRVFRGLLPLVIAIFLWSLYCRIDHGTWAFWSHSVSVNVETGLSAEAEEPGDWWINGFSVASTLLAWLLPWRIGWGIWVGLIIILWRSLLVPHGLQRSLCLLAVMMLGLWSGIGFIGQHEPGHNLYWKWLCPIVPVLIPLGAVGIWSAVDRLSSAVGQPVGRLLMVGVVAQVLGANAQETERQRERSEAWYRPQLDLAHWVESEIPETDVLVLDNIPACWIRRRASDREMVSWFDVPVPKGNQPDFARWIKEQEVRWVLWYREEWTQAPVVAPFLSGGGVWTHGQVSLVERKREDGYGWIWYQVVLDTDP